MPSSIRFTGRSSRYSRADTVWYSFMKASSTGRKISSPVMIGAVSVSVPRGAERSLGRDNVGLLEIDQHAAAGRDIALAGFAQLERAGGAMKQLGPDMGLEEGDRAAHRRRRPAKPPARAGEAALVDGRHKDFHRVDAVHGLFHVEDAGPRKVRIRPLGGKPAATTPDRSARGRYN